MHGKQPIRGHRGYEQSQYGGRPQSKKHTAPNFTGTGLRVDLYGCGMDDGGDYSGKSEYAGVLSGRAHR